MNGGSNSSIPVYLTASGGNAGSGTNSTILLMAALGSCNTVNSSTYVVVNEVTTVAAAYALGPFMSQSNPTQIGYPASSSVGIQHAFTTAANLANIGAGAANAVTPNGKGAIPYSTIDTLADILAYCVNWIVFGFWKQLQHAVQRCVQLLGQFVGHELSFAYEYVDEQYVILRLPSTSRLALTIYRAVEKALFVAAC